MRPCYINMYQAQVRKRSEMKKLLSGCLWLVALSKAGP